MNNFKREDLEKIFSGIPKEKLDSAIKKADVLSKNPQIRNSFSKISESQIKEMMSALSKSDRQKIISTLGNGNNKEIAELIKNLKNNL